MLIPGRKYEVILFDPEETKLSGNWINNRKLMLLQAETVPVRTSVITPG